MTPEKSEAASGEPRTYGTLMLGLNGKGGYTIWHSPSTEILSASPRDTTDRIQCFKIIWRFTAAAGALGLEPELEQNFIDNMAEWEAEAAEFYDLIEE